MNYANGTVEGTGAAINVTLGFKPTYVKVWNIDATNPVVMEWAYGMGQATGVLETRVVDTDTDTDTVTTGAGQWVLNIDAGDVAPSVGDVLEGGTSGASGTVVSVGTPSAGAWTDGETGGDAEVAITINAVAGLFQNDDAVTNASDSDSAVGNAVGFAESVIPTVPTPSTSTNATTASPTKLSSLGVSRWGGAVDVVRAEGFKIGADTTLNVDGQTLVYIAMG